MPRRRPHHSSNSSAEDETYDPNRDRQRRYRTTHPDQPDRTHAERDSRYRAAHPEQADPTHAERDSRYRAAHPRSDTTGNERQKRMVDKHRIPTTINDLNEPTVITPKVGLEEHKLGERNNVCLYCSAIHFSGDHVCCQNGQIFIPPFKRMPDQLECLLFDINDERRGDFISNILAYNTLFSFASVQFNHVPVKKYGLQVAKAQGSVRHFSSAVIPNNPDTPSFANFYVYEGHEAVKRRIENPILSAGLNEDVIRTLDECLQVHPFSRFYKKMGEPIDNEEINGGMPLLMRMKVVDPYDYEKQHPLQGHHGIYAVERSDDYVSVYFSADVDQRVLPRGLIIYPKLRWNVPKPLFFWRKEVNCLCYPLLFPNGDPGYFWQGYYRYEPLSFDERLRQYIEQMDENGGDIASTWDPDPDEHTKSRHTIIEERKTLEGDPNLEDSDDEMHEDDYDGDLVQTMSLQEESTSSHRVIREEKNGEHYPKRTTLDIPTTQTQLDDYDSGEDEDRTGEINLIELMLKEIHDTGQLIQADPTHAERDSRYRAAHPRSDTTGNERQKRMVDKHRIPTTINDLNEPTVITPKVGLEEHKLGERNNVCLYCSAIHFSGDHVCCQNGQIFIPPFKRMPDQLECLLFDINDERRGDFISNILAYNTLFSFASVQFNHVPVKKYGLQVAKAQGSVRHFSSAVIPNNPDTPSFANFYVYEGHEAVKRRIENPILSAGLNEDVIRTLDECLQVHPFSRFYKKMGEPIDNEEINGGMPLLMRMKVVDPYDYEKQHPLQGHHGIYAVERSDDYVSVYFSADVDQRVLPRGLIIYPKLRWNVPKPLFFWRKEVNCLCYPLLFPNGDPGYFWQGYYRYEPLSFDERLRQYIEQMDENGGDIASTWDPDPDEHTKSRHTIIEERKTLEGDPNLEDSDDEMHEDDYDGDLVQTMSLQEESTSSHRVIREEKNGEHYPKRTTLDIPTTQTQLDDYDSGEDEDRTGEENVQIVPVSSNELSIERENSVEIDEIDTKTEEESETADETIIEPNEEEEGELNDLEELAEGRRKRLYVSLREWALYVSQDRRRFHNRVCESGKLGQVFIIDQMTRIQQQRLTEIEKHNTEYMTSTKKKLIKAFQRTASRHNKTVGAVTSVPASMPGSPRYLQKKYEDAVAMANKLGKPDLFLTFTCSTRWPELKENLKKSQTWADNPFLLNEVFNKKKESLLNDILGERVKKGSRIRKPGLFGAVRWYVYCIEFQDRGPPHMHLIISLVEHIKTVQQVDAICSAELPVVPKDKNHTEYNYKSKLRDLVETYMVHTPCEVDETANCRIGTPSTWKKCRKNFPKPFSNKTEMGDKDYPALKRPDNGEKCQKKAGNNFFTATNQHVVAYNPFLLYKYKCHMNIEAISSLKVVKYIFKYLFKGYDRALVECFENVGIEGSNSYGVGGEMTMQGHVMMPKNLKLPPGVVQQRLLDAKDQLRRNHIPLHDEHGEKVLVYNECRFIEDMRCMTSCEAAWEIAGYGRSGSSHNVVTGFVHRPDEEPIRMEIGEEEEALHDIEREDVQSKLKAYFELCSSVGPDAEAAQDITFEDLPKRFIYNNGKWQLRKRNYSEFTIGKIKFVKPQFMEQFAIRLLCIHKKGVKSFEDLRTVDGRVYDTFIDAAKALRLMNGEAEWEMCLAEAASLKNPTVLRRLFVSILLNCAPENPADLWEHHKENFYENRKWSYPKKEAHALYHIQTALQSHGFQLEDFFLPEIQMENMPDKKDWVNDATGQIFTKNESEKRGDLLYARLTREQKAVVDEIIESVESGRRKPFFIEGQGGCGKTLIYETLFYILEGKGMKVICVAHTGVAASLLPQGSTVHRAFNIPLEVEEKMHSRIEMESSQAQHLRDTTVVLWDEATMTDRRIVQAVNELFSFLHPEQPGLFGGTTFVFGGDWRQTLPIVEGTQAEGVIDYTLIRSELWQKMKLLHLTENLRAKNDPEFAKWIKDVGEGVNYLYSGMDDIRVPEKYLVQSETQLIDEIYGNGKVQDENVTATSSILTVDNATSLELNEKVLLMDKSVESRTMLSRDKFDHDRGFAALPAEYYNNLTPGGLPPHKLNIKVGSVVMLLKNINVYLGICNGLRMRITKIGDDLIQCKPINGAANTPDLILLHRMALYPKRGGCRELSFVRWQFPVRLAYALTINKSQGQTLGQVGICLRTPVFTHGQFYVAISRVRTGASLMIHNGCSEDKTITRNVVYKEVLCLPHNN